MIIECPACSTRYDIKAQLPPEGRTVRCAKCNTVWRAMPLIEEAETEAEPEAESGQFGAGEAAAADATGEDVNGSGGPEHDQDALAGHAHGEAWDFGASHSADYAANGEEAPGGEPQDRSPSFPFEAAGGSSLAWKEEEPEEQREDEGTGKVRWFGGFLRRNQAKGGPQAEEGIQAAQPAPVSAETIPFPRPALAPEPQMPAGEESLRTLDEARAAVRNVFASLGEQRPALSGRGFQAPVTAGAGAEPDGIETSAPGEHHQTASLAASSTWMYGSREESQHAAEDTEGLDEQTVESGVAEVAAEIAGSDAWHSTGDAGEESADASQHNAWLQGWTPGTEDAGDPDAELRNALRAHFPGRAAAADPDEYTGQQFAPSATEDEAEAPAPARFAPAWVRPEPFDEPASQMQAHLEEAQEPSDNDTSFDHRLYREIEETQEHAGELKRREGRGGLALAAAWGLFLCVAAGLIVGFVAFRDITADALPGFAPIYRVLGMPVTVQPLIFEGVQYEWTISENKPMLLITGAVYNRAHRKVKVPDFVISIKDDDPALDREYSATLQAGTDKIRPDQRADFQIELLSPNPSITAVELELRDVR